MNLRRDAAELARALDRLATSLQDLALPDPPGDDRLRRRRGWLVSTIRDYLIPRSLDPAAPMVVVFAGPTGAGKSTLLNSVIGAEHSLTGPLRPTTDRPLVVTSEDRAAEYRSLGGVECGIVMGRAPILRELALVDTPDIDSTSEEHRVVAETLIDHADVVVFVTSAIRYGDRVPWEVLRRAHSRSVPVIHVLNRLSRSSSGALADYAARLVAEGLDGTVVAVHEHHLRPGAHSLPTVVIDELRDRLVDLVEERRSGAAHVFKRVLDSVVDQTDELASVVSARLSALDAARSSIAADLAPDSRRVVANLRPVGPEGLRLAEIASLADRRFRTAGRVRRRLPGPRRVEAVTSFLGAALVLAIEADVHDRVGEHLSGDETLLAMGRIHRRAERSISEWLAEVREEEAVARAIDPGLAGVALIAACLGVWPDQPVTAVWEVVAGDEMDVGLCSRVSDALHRRLLGLYSEVAELVLAAIGSVDVSEEKVDQVREAMTGVVARASFADA